MRTTRQIAFGARGFAAIAALLLALLMLCMPVTSVFAGEAVEGLENGTYTIKVMMAGGSGKATVDSPCTLEVADGKAYATLAWSSENYDYMVVDGEKIMPVTTKPTSQFKVPVRAFDTPLIMVGDTTAMGAPHEIEYSFTFDSASVEKVSAEQAQQQGQSSGQSAQQEQSGQTVADADTEQILMAVTIGSLLIALIAVGITIGVLRSYRRRR